MAAATKNKMTSLAAGQWGMFTAAQAQAAGVARSTVLRREQSGAIERMRSGVYRLSGSPTDPADDIRAAWLATNPEVQARDRRDAPDAVVGGAAAASLHGLGDLYPSPFLIYTTTRRRTRHDDVRFSVRPLPDEDVTILDGLPLTTRERTISDLLGEPGTDLSVVADALRDALTSSWDIDVPSLTEHLQRHARRLGYSGGVALYQHLRLLTRVDEERLRELLVGTDLTDQLNASVQAQIREIIAPMAAVMSQQTRNALEPLLRSVSRGLDLPHLRVMPSGLAAPKITLPPGLLPEMTLPATTRAALEEWSRVPLDVHMPMPGSRAGKPGEGRRYTRRPTTSEDRDET